MSAGTKRPSVSRINSRSLSPATIRLKERFASSNSATRLDGRVSTRSRRCDSTERAAAAMALTGRLARVPSHAASPTETTKTASPTRVAATSSSNSSPSGPPSRYAPVTMERMISASHSKRSLVPAFT